MMSMEIKRVHRNGITFMGRNYYDEALYGLKERVMIRYDFDDLSRVFVYDITGSRLICEAPVIKQVHPMAILGGKEDMEAVKEGIRRKRSLAKLTIKVAKEQIRQAPALITIPERVAPVEQVSIDSIPEKER
jgi:putative transposase